MKPLLKYCLRVLFIIAFSILFVGSSNAVIYEPGDWVDFNNFRYISSITSDNNVVYFGTTGGVIRYDTGTDSWLYPLTIANGLPSNNVQELAFDLDYNALWIITDQGTGNYNLTFESWTSDDNFPGQLAVNEWNPGAFASLFMPFNYDYSDGYVSDPEMQRYAVTVGYKDDFTDEMYVGTWGMGAGTIDTRQLDYTILNYGPYNQSISKAIKIGKALWMGTEFGSSESAITRYDLRSKAWNYYKSELIIGLDNTEVTCGTNSKDFIWLGTTNGLLKVENERSVRTYRSLANLPSAYIFSLAEYGGFLYIGTDNGITVFPPTGEVPDSLFKSPLPDEFLLRGQQVNDLLVFRDALYIATDFAVYSFNSAAHQFLKLDTPTADLSSGASDIASDSTNLYFGARFGVVVINSETDSSYLASDPSLEADWYIYEVYGDSSLIWAATNLGLWKYRKEDQYTYTYTTGDGLPVNEVNSIVRDGDYFWMGTRKGLVRFLWNASGRGD
jgi:ligand-binding sensor domain-containing protein